MAGKKTKSEMSKMGKAITSEAKKIREASPKMKWKTAIKQAGKELKGKF